MNAQIKYINKGQPKTVTWKGESIFTGIFKHPVEGKVPVNFFGVEGDGQGDKKHHGGRDKALYLYPMEHYDFWKEALGRDIEPGNFGENITSFGILEKDICGGDEFRFGNILVKAIAPRIPCIRLNLRFGQDDILKKFVEARRFGVYFKVLEEGKLQAGDKISLYKKSDYSFTFQDIVDLFTGQEVAKNLLEEMMEYPDLQQSIQTQVRKKLEKLNG